MWHVCGNNSRIRGQPSKSAMSIVEGVKQWKLPLFQPRPLSSPPPPPWEPSVWTPLKCRVPGTKQAVVFGALAMFFEDKLPFTMTLLTTVLC